MAKCQKLTAMSLLESSGSFSTDSLRELLHSENKLPRNDFRRDLAEPGDPLSVLTIQVTSSDRLEAGDAEGGYFVRSYIHPISTYEKDHPLFYRFAGRDADKHSRTFPFARNTASIVKEVDMLTSFTSLPATFSFGILGLSWEQTTLLYALIAVP